MCNIQTPPMRVSTFSGLRGGVNSLCNMVNRSHDFHSTVASATSEKASPVLPKGDMFETFTDKAKKLIQFAQKETVRFGYKCVGMVNRSHDFRSTVASATSEKASLVLPKGDMFDTFTDKANKVILFAQKETRRFGYKFVGTEMILLGLIGNDFDRFFGESTDIAKKVLYSMDINLKNARERVLEIFGCGGRPSLSAEIPFRPSALRAFELSLAEAQQLGHNYIGSEHLLLGLLSDEDGDANLVLRKLGACPINIRTQVMRMIEESAAEVVGDGSSGNEMPTLDLEEYGLNLTALADEKKLHPFVQGNKMPTLEDNGVVFGINLSERACKEEWIPVIERKPLINTVIQILGRRSKNNPCLVGEKSVGKTSVVKGLVQRIRDLDVPDFLSKKKVIALKEYIFARNRLENLMEEIKDCNEIIIFIDIDEVYDYLDSDMYPFVNIMMPAVARGEVQCAIAATPDAYLRMKKYPALERLFQPIKVPEATVDETFEILKCIKKELEMSHKVLYTDEALVAAAHMSDQCIRHGFLPGKAIDVMDIAGSSVFNKTIHKARDQEIGHKMNMLEIEQMFKCLRPTVTKADIEDVVWDISGLMAITNQFFGYDKSYREFANL